MSEQKKRASFGTLPWWATALIGVAIVGIFLLSFFLADTSDAEEGEAFGGTDSIATEELENQGEEPWFEPVFEPGSGEVESGLFALQAALGASVFGYVVGRFHGRHDRKASAAPALAPVGAAGPAPADLPETADQ